jgi:hypothetical protein
MAFYGGTEKERIASIDVIESSQEGFLTLNILTRSKDKAQKALDKLAELDEELGLNE